MSAAPFDALLLVENEAALGSAGGLGCVERMERTLRQLGAGRLRIRVVPRIGAARVQAAQRRALPATELSVGPTGCGDLAGLAAESRLLVVAADRIIDRRAIEALLARGRPAALVDRSAEPGAGLPGAAVVAADWLRGRPSAESLEEALVGGLEDGSLEAVDVAALPTYSRPLRRDFPPFWYPAPRSPRESAMVRAHLLDATQKGALDLPAHFHAPIEKLLTRAVAPTRWTPNQITLVTNLVAWSATALLATGRLGAGLLVAMVVGVLDGVDGKLARLRLETSKLGELEHFFDFLFEWSWWTALAYYFAASGRIAEAWALWGVLAGSELVGGLAKLVVKRRFGLVIDEMSGLDRAIRFVAGRRNVYVWLLVASTLAGRVEDGFRLLAGWALATAVVHAVRATLLVLRSRRTDEGYSAEAVNG